MQTRTYAEILARQGELGQAIDIYRGLLGKKPGDAELTRRLAELEALAAGAPPEAPKSPAQERLEALLHRIQSRRRRL
jgi:hypothetical protein